MHVISEKKLREFWKQWPEAEVPLRVWHRVAEHATWGCFADVRAVYPSADQLGRCTVFKIDANKFRLVVVIHFDRGKVYIRHVLTHKQYDRGTWKGDC
jgi:mRNA interferase HigB